MSAGQAASNRIQRESERVIRHTADDAKARYMKIIARDYAGQPLPVILGFLQSAYAQDVATIEADRTIGMHLGENVRHANMQRITNRAHRVQGLKELQKEGTRLAAYEIYQAFMDEEEKVRVASDRVAAMFRAQIEKGETVRRSENVARRFRERIAAYVDASREAAEVAAAAVPRAASPVVSPRAASPRAASPHAASPRAASPVASRAASPRAAGGARRTKRKGSKAKKSRKHK